MTHAAQLPRSFDIFANSTLQCVSVKIEQQQRRRRRRCRISKKMTKLREECERKIAQETTNAERRLAAGGKIHVKNLR